MVGEYSIRGGIVDIFSPEASHPVRIELFGDEIESIRRFPPMPRFEAMIRAAGFSQTKVEPILGGLVAIHSGWKV